MVHLLRGEPKPGDPSPGEAPPALAVIIIASTPAFLSFKLPSDPPVEANIDA